ncbi:hypothetical protein SDRG_08454 [Saprolegnia diclina VS20]|uniref:Anoctamin transmembrane domain-containing protein n=1 Tax=Saprolegnia diclina (strain VS20) TaxID=1156394 RepID=T0RV36_SAPDV|nr:hypothetical protein SDRG_08454 [Saprolegnia diclina VS20]EQC34252.1 hypothetical protein SDRG_08454 [Saprolegnia diclina VS20]|eukprot:XP_008612564.1 hypothetical protein SDRG_08454 [Saprolegnia diclina VS20]
MKAMAGKAALGDVKLHVLNGSLDPFEQKFGYNYDYVFVFKVHDETHKLTEAQTTYSMRLILQRLAGAGLETRMFYSTTRDLVFCKIRASYERLCKEADRIDLKLDPEVRTKRVLASLLLIFALILLVIGAVASIFVFRIFAERGRPLYEYTTLNMNGKDVPLASPIASTLNAIQIQVMNGIYTTIAVRLNNYENHRTDTEYEDNLIAKTFLFQFVNSYASLFYIAFIKSTVDVCTDPKAGGCIYDLMVALGIIFCLRLTSGNFFEAVLPYLKRRLRGKCSKPATPDDGETRAMSIVEDQMTLGVYDDMGVFGDYNEMIIQYGYITLFVISFPLAPFLALLNNYFEIRIDAFKLAKESRRPDPKGAEDIGTWMTILEIMSTIAVITNVAAAVFTSNTTFSGVSGDIKMLAFVGLEHGVLLVKYFLALLVDDVPEDVQLQLDRSKFLVNKVVFQIQDDDDDDLVKGNKIKVDLTVYDDDE